MLTPIDIQNRTLKTTMGGYNKKDTDDFIATILESYEQIYKENHDLKEKIASLSEGVQYYKQMENTLQKALILAEKTSTEIQEAAKSQAASIVKEANVKADTMLQDIQTKINIVKSKANHELEETQNYIRKLVQSYENYRLQFKKIAASQIEMLESEAFAIHVPEVDKLKEDFDFPEDISDTIQNTASTASLKMPSQNEEADSTYEYNGASMFADNEIEDSEEKQRKNKNDLPVVDLYDEKQATSDKDLDNADAAVSKESNPFTFIEP